MGLGNRKLHCWLSLAAALPALVILATGILLLLRTTGVVLFFQPILSRRRRAPS